jgi:hypothetical protein
MEKRCNPHMVQKTHLKTRSWRRAAQELNSIYGVNLSHLTWRDYGTRRRDITDPKTRAALMLRPRITYRNKPRVHFSRLLKHMTAEDLQIWNELRKQKRYKAAYRFLEEIYNRK